MEPPPFEPEESLQLRALLMPTPAKALIDKDIPLVEYGPQMEWRNGYPEVLVVSYEFHIYHSASWTLLTSWSQVVEWAVPDELLPLAS